MYYNKQGKEIEMLEWAELLENPKYKVISQTTTKSGKWVSTVWLGLDHQYGEGKPLIFETMVFPKKGDYSDEFCERYSTLKEAKAGHKVIVKKFSEE